MWYNYYSKGVINSRKDLIFMKKLKRIGYLLLVLIGVVSFWVAASFIDIATKNHPSDKNYKGYHRWNIIIILNDFSIEKGCNI